ncbi:MAG: hypothetical protein GYA55_03650 [SAR324 cluster bacterium]|uniref:SAM-dependent chlorinase/fluorinase n=1 Tax=SAR324 cluster bacterium TaxID=2024889 RepID=A0A7X9FQ41_9DELT|nr:hypothetical protein [SAR324 cluster bacterium]
MERKLLHVVSDYAQGSLGAGNLQASILSNLPTGWDLIYSSVYNFDTLSAGYLLGQYGLQNEDLRPSELMLFASCSPRFERPRDASGTEREAFYYGTLRNGVRVIAVNSGYTLSFLRGSFSELREIRIENCEAGVQRPRNFLPGIVGHLIAGNTSWLGAELDPLKVISEYPPGVVCYIDSFGNIKTTYTDHDEVIRHIKTQGSGARIRIEINGEVRAATLGIGTTDPLEGDTLFAPQSGAFLNRFWEISCRRADASANFNNPPPGSSIKLMIHQK